MSLGFAPSSAPLKAMSTIARPRKVFYGVLHFPIFGTSSSGRTDRERIRVAVPANSVGLDWASSVMASLLPACEHADLAGLTLD